MGDSELGTVRVWVVNFGHGDVGFSMANPVTSLTHGPVPPDSRVDLNYGTALD